MTPTFTQLDLVVRDMDATLRFYRALGLEIPDEAVWRTDSGAHHANATMPGGAILHFVSPALATVYDRGWREPSGTGTRAILTFNVAAREEVDRLHRKLTQLGYKSAQDPFDALWGARYAVLEDPDATHIGLMSPKDDTRRTGLPQL